MPGGTVILDKGKGSMIGASFFGDGMEEQSLVGRLSRGDHSAAGELVARYKQPLYAFIMRMIGDPATADDIFQETWIQVVRKIGSFEARSKFSTWLFQIALNKCRDEIRKHARRTFIDIDEHAERIGCEPDVNPFRMMTAGKVREMVDALPEKLREVTVLRYFHDLNDSEIADIAGCPVSTVRTRCFRAAERMRAYWRKHELNESYGSETYE